MDACYPSIQETEVRGPLMRPVWATCWDRISKTEQNKRNPFLLEGWRVLLDASTGISTQSCTKYSWNTNNGISLPAFLTTKNTTDETRLSAVPHWPQGSQQCLVTHWKHHLPPAPLLLWKASKAYEYLVLCCTNSKSPNRKLILFIKIIKLKDREYKYHSLNNSKLKLMKPLASNSTSIHVIGHIQNVGILKVGHKITFGVCV